MDAELKIRFGKLEEEDQRKLLIILQWQFLHKPGDEVILELSKPAAEWLLDYETDLLGRIEKKEIAQT